MSKQRDYQKSYQRDRYETDKNKEHLRCRIKRLKKFDMTLEDYQEMFDAQLGSCAICNKIKIKEDKLLAVDHCHTTGKVRGLLCQKCNTALGQLEDNVESLQRAIDYLKKV